MDGWWASSVASELAARHKSAFHVSPRIAETFASTDGVVARCLRLEVASDVATIVGYLTVLSVSTLPLVLTDHRTGSHAASIASLGML